MSNEIKWDASAPLVVHQHPYFAGVIKMEKVIKDGKEVIEWDQVSPPDAPGRINIDPVTGNVGIGTVETGALQISGFTPSGAITFYGGTADSTEVMRITKDGVWVNPDLSVDDAAKVVLRAIDTEIKTMVQRAVVDERKRIVNLLMIQHEMAKERHNYWHVAAQLIQADIASNT